ncbi:16S rRNA (guanine(966)-N(2))-methyltransferase RsmD [Novisyntrophococcus fermenticellae]|uniref:16S rRNA (guanine(966)-N(2))-methyltransferase RsmD n=1 Tax=Novisyntrophococcus fermenticellae TaxID=2068655 RepID=UPI001E5A20A4|nr:16S rRNA (guanine(966)-N(2))-methyltransferase RsmD [Novisyntrophococcus fermenticellae]
MRVIAGSCKSLPLQTIEGLDTRPTTDRIKETLFNMIQSGLEGSVFLDLFAGSGGIGIEALSRGAKEACFVEQNPKAAACIRENLRFTKLEQRGKVLQTDVRLAAGNFHDGPVFDYIFMDPPYDRGLEKEVLALLSGSECIDRDTTIIVEASLKTDFSYLEGFGFAIKKEKKYKTNKHVFLYRR